MEAFSISCTTCQARLKVTDPQAVGKILPCPKCGSMVMVQPPSSVADAAAVAGAMPPVAGSRDAARELLGNDAFDHIDQLLEGTNVSDAVPDQRWKSARPASASKSDPGPRAVDAKPGGAPSKSPSAEQVDKVAESVRDKSNEVDADAVAEPPVEDWLANSTDGVLRRYGGWIAGVSLGVVLAAGVVVVTARREPPKRDVGATSIGANEALPVVDDIDQLESEPTNVVSQQPAEDAAADPQVSTEVDRAVDAPDTEDDASPVEDPVVVIEEDAPADNLDVPPPLPIPDDGAAEVTRSPVTDVTPATRSDQITTDDELAGFAQWLQAANEDNTPSPVADAPAAPVVEVIEIPVTRTTRPVPDQVDVETLLRQRIPAIEFKNVPLTNVLRALTDLSSIPITVDLDALGRRNLTVDASVNLLMQDRPLSDVLNGVLEPFHLGFVAADGHLRITTAADSRGELSTIPHDVADLSDGDPQTTATLAEWIQQLVSHATWQGQGGEGVCEPNQTTLIVKQADGVQFQVLVFCEKLRLARGSSPRSRLRPEALDLSPRWLQMKRLADPITLRIWDPSSLNRIAAELEQVSGVRVVVDWQALHLAGWSPRDEVTLFCHDRPLREVLGDLLNPMELTFRVVDAETLEITSLESAYARCDVEFYPLGERAASVEQVQTLSQQIVQRVGRAQFQPHGAGAVAYDPVSKTLIVSLPQPLQRHVYELLETSGE